MDSKENTHDGMKKNNYGKFMAMLGLSFIAMYITMYLNTYEWDHVWFSLTRFYMVCLGIAAMALIMLSQEQEKKHSHLFGEFNSLCQCIGTGTRTKINSR